MAFAAAAIPYMMAAAAAVTVVAAVQQGRAAKAASEYNAQMDARNAQMAREQAALQAQQAEREGYMRLGSIRAAQGKSGGRAAEGSVIDVLGDVAAQNELQRQDILYRGSAKAYGYESDAALERYEGKQAQTAGYLKAGSALLSGASSTAGAFKRV